MTNQTSLSIEKEQKEFLDTTIGKVINKGIELGIRAIFPDFIENQVIELKDVLINEGFLEMKEDFINKCLDTGKSAAGMITGNFENINQVQMAIQKGGLIDTISDAVDYGIKIATDKDIIPSSIAKVIKQGKNTIINNISNNIENLITKQVSTLENISKYNEKWNEYYNTQDFDGMEKYYKKIEKALKDVVPFENTIKEARKIENIHEKIKQNGKNFDLTQQELELAEKLIY